MRTITKVASAIFAWIAVLAVIVYVYRDLVNSFLGSSIASSALLIILILVDLFGPFTLRWLNNRGDEQLKHYDQLKRVFVHWKDVGPGGYNEVHLLGEELIQASFPLYLRVDLFPYDHYTHNRVVNHLKAEKYQPIRDLLSSIYRFEDDHNASVSLLLGDIGKDIKAMLEKFPSLKEREPSQQKNYYYYAAINNTIQNRLKPQSNRDNPESIDYAGVAALAAISDVSTRQMFLKEIAALVDKYSPRIQTAIDDRAKLETLLSELKAYGAEVVDGIDTYHKLDGKCDFEKQ